MPVAVTTQTFRPGHAVRSREDRRNYLLLPNGCKMGGHGIALGLGEFVFREFHVYLW
jgi:hypothetical protein